MLGLLHQKDRSSLFSCPLGLHLEKDFCQLYQAHAKRKDSVSQLCFEEDKACQFPVLRFLFRPFILILSNACSSWFLGHHPIRSQRCKNPSRQQNPQNMPVHLLLAIHMLFALNTSTASAWYGVLQTEGHDPQVDLEVDLDGGRQHLKSDFESNWIEQQVSVYALCKGIVSVSTHPRAWGRTYIYVFVFWEMV